ncbi:phage minor head protein [Lactococcus petauri]|uniref:phage minor head protein n=1 Tax=Lactococcus petauri TaxID=1940789 RepID=UPI0018AAEBF5|nr:phage minor head protein [Lactococcus petauri]MDC0827000.1 phage minor head protein [Lactococcus petauri]
MRIDEIIQQGIDKKKLHSYYETLLKDVNKQVELWLDKYNDLSFSKKIEFERLLNINNEIRQIIGQPSIDIAETIKSHVITEGHNGYNSVYYGIESKYNVNLNFSFLDDSYLKALMNSPVAGKTLSQRLYKYRSRLAKQISDAISRGMAFGYSYSRIAQEIATISEASYRQALRIARTEGGRIRSNTTQKGYQEAKSKGVDLQKQWVATLDVRTRQDHGQLDGQIREVDELFEVNGYKGQGPRLFGIAEEDINCRCTTVTVVNGVSPKLINPDGTKSKWQNYDEWLAYQKVKAENSITGLVAKDGLTISGMTDHLKERIVEREVNLENIVNAILNPLFIYPDKVDEFGRISRKYLGEYATIVINPEDGSAITTMVTSSRLRRKYGKNK